MNIFILDEDPVVAAQAQCDKHVVKMVLESAQMLSTTHRLLGENHQVFYKTVHQNHPCTVWTRRSSGNYLWHLAHWTALCDEYRHRYQKVHKTDQRLRQALGRLPDELPTGEQTPFAIALGDHDDCRCEDAVETYRRYYLQKQNQFVMRWTRRPPPSWLRQKVDRT